MPRFLAVYTKQPDGFAGFNAMSSAEQDALNAAGLKAWQAWRDRNAANLVGDDLMVGKTKRVTKDGVTDTSNIFCGCLIVEAESAEAAADMFRDHPHFNIFPGDGVDIMPIVAGA